MPVEVSVSRSAKIGIMEKQPDLMTFTTDLDDDMFIDFGQHGTWDKGHSESDVAASVVPLMRRAIYDQVYEKGGEFSITYQIHGYFPPSSVPRPPDPFSEAGKQFWRPLTSGAERFVL